MSDLDRFMAKINVLPNGCWEWTAFVHPNGYGVFSVKAKPCQAHRWAYEHFCGPLQPGLTIDHRCHDRSCRSGKQCQHRRCVNPAHLQQITNAENVRRGNAGRLPRRTPSERKQRRALRHSKRPAFCKHGHPLSGDNLYVRANGTRHCRTCRRAAVARYDKTEHGREAAKRAASAYRARQRSKTS